MVRLFNYDVSDRLGFYKVGDLRFYGKFDAVKVMEKTGQHLTFHYHDEAFASHDWTREPLVSLGELYRRRAQQLREQYDYLVICYSGGADSDNILDAFVDNGIPVDEILTYHGSRFGKDEWYNAEVYRVAVPKAQAIVDRSPGTRLRLLDVTEHMIEFWANGDEEDLDSLLHRHGTGYNAFGMAWVNQLATFPDYVRLKDQGKRIGFVVGYDKPRVWQVDGRWCHRFIDIYCQTTLMGADMPTEPFYWHPNSADMMIKQCHVIRRYMESANENSPYITRRSTGMSCRQLDDGSWIWLEPEGVNQLLYPNWSTATFSVGKDPYAAFGMRDQWFWTSTNEQAYQNWHTRIQKWWQDLPDYWRNDVSDVLRGFKHSWSRPYYLE